MVRNGAERPVAIVGGGIAGLTTAYYLGKAGVKVDLYEAEEEVGGLARSFDFEGIRTERYYHFICLPDQHLRSLAEELGLSHSLFFRRTRTTFFHQGKLYPFTSPYDLLTFSPIPVWSRVKLGLHTLRWSGLKQWRALDQISAKEWLISNLGNQAYELVWHPLLSMKFAQYYERVSAAWLWHRIWRIARSRKSPLHPQVMGHFQGGSETLIKALKERILQFGSIIHCQSPVLKVKSQEGKVCGIKVWDRELEYQAVVLTAPLPQSAKLLPPEMESTRTLFNQIIFLGVICLVLWLKQSLSNSFWCNVYDPRIPFSGMIELSQLNPEMRPEGALVYVPYYLPLDALRFSFSDQQLVQEFLNALQVLKPDLDESVLLSYRIFRSDFAQPICTVGFEKIKPAHTTPVKGLFLTDSTQLYPEDRTISGTIGLAKTVSKLVLEYLRK